MDDLEKALREALERQPAPEGFASRVLERARLSREPRLSWWRTRWILRPIAAALATLCLIAVVAIHRHEEQIRGERAREQVLQALRITGSKLLAVQDRLRDGNHDRRDR